MGIQDERILRPLPSALPVGSHYQITQNSPGPLPYHIVDPDPKETYKYLLPIQHRHGMAEETSQSTWEMIPEARDVTGLEALEGEDQKAP